MSPHFRLGASLALASAVLTACSSSSFEVASVPDSGGDVAVDAGADSPSDAAPETRPADAGAFQCRNAGDCSDSEQYCCATFSLGAGAIPNCPINEASTHCQASCPTSVPTSCPSPARVKICRDARDCESDTQNPRCCRLYAGGVIGTACVSEFIASYSGASCL